MGLERLQILLIELKFGVRVVYVRRRAYRIARMPRVTAMFVMNLVRERESGGLLGPISQAGDVE